MQADYLYKQKKAVKEKIENVGAAQKKIEKKSNTKGDTQKMLKKPENGSLLGKRPFKKIYGASTYKTTMVP